MKNLKSFLAQSILFISLICVSLICLSFYSDLPINNQQTQQPNITIKGSIESFETIKTQFAKDSYLQLMVLPKDGGYGASTDSIGRLIIKTDLPKAIFASDGSFVFKLKNLDPGTYLIVAQLLKGRSYNSPAPFFKQNSELLKIIIIEGAQFPLTIDLGKCSIPE
jgi:hypothetical protein